MKFLSSKLTFQNWGANYTWEENYIWTTMVCEI